MLTKEQANLAADQLIEQQERLRNEERNTKAPPVPFALRMPELKSFEPWRCFNLVQQAKSNIAARREYQLASAAAIIFMFVLILWLYPIALLEYGFVAALLFIAGTLPPFLVHVFFVRREIRTLIAGLNSNRGQAAI